MMPTGPNPCRPCPIHGETLCDCHEDDFKNQPARTSQPTTQDERDAWRKEWDYAGHEYNRAFRLLEDVDSLTAALEAQRRRAEEAERRLSDSVAYCYGAWPCEASTAAAELEVRVNVTRNERDTARAEASALREQLEGERLNHRQIHTGCHEERDRLRRDIERIDDWIAVPLSGHWLDGAPASVRTALVFVRQIARDALTGLPPAGEKA